MALFLICSFIAGNYRFKLNLIFNNSIALISILLFVLFTLGLLYTTAPPDEALAIFKKYVKFIYVPLLLFAFHEMKWKRIGYLAFLSGVTLMLVLSYMTFFGWSPEGIYSGTYAGREEPVVFRSRIAHGMLVAFTVYLYLLHALNTKDYRVRIGLMLLAIFASINILAMVTSRSAQLLWVILMVLLIYQFFGWRRALLGAIIVPLLGVSLLYSSEATRVRLLEIFNDVELIKEGNYASSLGIRLIWAESGLHTLKKNPIIGTGTGSFKQEFNSYLEIKNINDTTVWSWISDSMNPHNEYISISVQLGLLGLFIYLLLFIQQWKLSNRLPLLTCYIAKGFIVTLVVSGLLNSVIFAHTQGVFFALFTALIFSSYSSYTEKNK